MWFLKILVDYNNIEIYYIIMRHLEQWESYEKLYIWYTVGVQYINNSCEKLRFCDWNCVL